MSDPALNLIVRYVNFDSCFVVFTGQLFKCPFSKAHPRRVDYEYERAGTACIFMFADEVRPSVGIDLSAGKTEAGFAGESDASGFTAIAASVLYKAHLFRIATVEHFLNGVGVIRAVKAWIGLFKRIPMIVEDVLECVFIKAFHGCSLGTTIPKLAG